MQARARVTPTRGGSATAGSVTDEQFRSSFEAVPVVKINSTKELISECQKHAEILENTNNDWSKRIKSLQFLRSVLVNGAADNAEFVSQVLPFFGTALLNSVKDLRSQVCREACITVAYFTEKMGTSFWKVAELLYPTLINLVQNSAKVMATSASNAAHYVAKNIHHSKILTLIVGFVSSKSKDIRRCTASLMSDIIGNWESHLLDKHWPEILQAVKGGLHDADPDARTHARQAFELLQSMYPPRADCLFQQLEPAKQRMLSGRTSTASSTRSINSERDNLQASNRGLYNAQQTAFLSKRSTSDLNHSIHSIRKMNLGRPNAVHRPNPVRTAMTKPPHAAAPTPNVKSTSAVNCPTPVIKKTLPSMNSATTGSSRAAENSLKSSSQPGSRSTSPNRFRPPRSHVAVNTNGTNGTSTFSTLSSRQHSVADPNKMLHRDVSRALKNVDTKPRVVPNVIRYDDDRNFAVSPTTGFVNRLGGGNSRLSGSPSDFSRRTPDKYGKFNSLDESSYSNGRNSNAPDNSECDKWPYASANELAMDCDLQSKYIREICSLLQSKTYDAQTEKDVEAALSKLSHMIREGAITLWDEYFNLVLLAILQPISKISLTNGGGPNDSAHAVKLSALRALKDLCLAHPKKMAMMPELVMINVLNAHHSMDATLVRVAEECGAALVTHLPDDVCLKLLISVIDDENTAYHQLSGAIKMLSRVMEKLPPEQVQQLLPSVVPRMMKCYENSQSMVRRAAIICLVATSNTIGMDILKPHLNASTLKLVQVYRDRMTKGK